MHHKATSLSQALIQQPIRNLPDPELIMEALEPGLKDIRAPQLLCNQAERWCLCAASQPTQGRTRRIQRLDESFVVYAVTRYHEIDVAPTSNGIHLPVQNFDCDMFAAISARLLWKLVFACLLPGRQHHRQVFSDVLAEDFQDVVLVCGRVMGYASTEGQGDDARYASAEFKDGGGGRQECVGKEEVCGGGDPRREKGRDGPYY